MTDLLKKYALGLLCFELVLVALHFGFGETRLFDLDREYNLPSWFSGIQLAVLGLASIIAFHNEQNEHISRWVWLVLAVGFFYLSFDEIMVIHEGFLRQEALDAIPGTSLLRGLPPWQVIFAPFALVAAIIFTFFFKSRFPLASGTWIPIAIGFALWGLAFALEGTAMGFFMPHGWYKEEVALEEFGEMAGATFLLFAIARYSSDTINSVTTTAGSSQSNSLIWIMPVVLLIVLPISVIYLLNTHEKQSVHYSSGMRLLKAEKYEEAVEALNLALKTDKDNIKTLKALAKAAYWSGNYDLAENAFQHAWRLAPEDASIRNGLSLLKLKKKRASSRP